MFLSCLLIKHSLHWICDCTEVVTWIYQKLLSLLDHHSNHIPCTTDDMEIIMVTLETILYLFLLLPWKSPIMVNQVHHINHLSILPSHKQLLYLINKKKLEPFSRPKVHLPWKSIWILYKFPCFISVATWLVA